MGKLKDIIEKPKKHTRLKKTNSSEENQQRCRELLQSKKGEIRKSKKLCEIELASSIKDRNFFIYFSNNKKQKSSTGSLHEKGDTITTDIETAEILNNHLDTVFTSENLCYILDFNLSYIV